MMLDAKRLRSVRFVTDTTWYELFEFVYYSNYTNYVITCSVTGKILYRYLSYKWAIKKLNKLSGYNLDM